MRKLAAFMLLIVGCLGVAVGWIRASTFKSVIKSTRLESSPQYVSGPDQWVPFRADVVITKPGSVKVVGRYYRASDGSTRIETGPSLEDVRVIFIRNVSQGLMYDWTYQQWHRERLQHAEYWKTPFRWRMTDRWSQYPYRLAIQRGQSGSAYSDVGFAAYRVVNSSGTVMLKIPDLNLFDAVLDRADGRHEEYTNIDLTEQSEELFVPPATAVVVERNASGKG